MPLSNPCEALQKIDSLLVGQLSKNRRRMAPVRTFLRGSDAHLDERSLAAIKRFLRARLRGTPREAFLGTFTEAEESSVRKAFGWVMAGLEPSASSGKIDHLTKTNLQNAHKISGTDVESFMLRLKPPLTRDQKRTLFGLITMLTNAITPADKRFVVGQDFTTFRGLAFRKKIVLGRFDNLVELGAAAAHELGHKKYRLDEPLCWAMDFAYRYAHGVLLAEQVLAEKENQFTPEYRREGLRIFLKALKQGNRWQDHFWKEVRTLARQRKYQWV